LPTFTRFAFDVVAEDVRIEARRSRQRRGRIERLLRRRDEVDLVAGERRIARLGRLQHTALEVGADPRRHRDRMPFEDGERLGAGGRIGHRRAAADHRRRVAGHVADEQGDDARRRARRGEAPALDRRQVLANAVHLVDRRTALQQCAVDRLLLFEGHAGRRQREQRRRAARHQADDQVVGREAARELENARRCAPAGLVGHRMRSLHDLDARRAARLRAANAGGTES
jgi:hypothetical protein